MNKSELTRLKELAEKATPGEWKVYNDISYIVTTGNPNEVIGWQWPDKNVFECNVEANSNYIAAANPETILAMINQIERLEKTVEEYKEYLSGIKKGLELRDAEEEADDAEFEKALADIERLEKEADWLAETLSAICHDADAGCAVCPKSKEPCAEISAGDWRKAAREAVEKENESHKSPD